MTGTVNVHQRKQAEPWASWHGLPLHLWPPSIAPPEGEAQKTRGGFAHHLWLKERDRA